MSAPVDVLAMTKAMRQNARFQFVAVHMSPQRKVLNIDARNDGVTLTLECGHVEKCVPHFTYRVDSKHICYKCGEEAAAREPEFAALANVGSAS